MVMCGINLTTKLIICGFNIFNFFDIDHILCGPKIKTLEKTYLMIMKNKTN